MKHLNLLCIHVNMNLLLFIVTLNLNYKQNAHSFGYSYLQDCKVSDPESFFKEVKGCSKRISHYFI